MKEQLFDLIDEQDFVEVFRIISENASKFPDNQTFRDEYAYNYTGYNGVQQLAYRNALKTFVSKCLSSPSASHLPPPSSRFLTCFTPAGKVIGREESIEALHQHLRQPQALPAVVVNGLGGIGKTTVARQYAFEYQAHYDHIVWLEQTSTLLHTFIMNESLTAGKDFEGKNELTRFEILIQDLAGRQGTNLLIIDNYALTDADKPLNLLAYFQDIRLQHWRVLFTSREQVHGFTPIRLGILSEPKAIELFRTHATDERIDETELKELLKLIDYHTLTIELLAKSYQHSLALENLAQLTDILRQNALDAEALNKPIPIGDSQEEKLFYQHLDMVFSISRLSKNERHVLKQFAVLPALPIAGKDFLDWITLNLTWAGKIWQGIGKILGLGTTLLFVWTQSKATYEKALFSLAKKGWLTYHADKTFEMHRLMQMFLLHKFQPNDFDCYILYHHIKKLLDISKVQSNPLAHQWLLEYGEALLAGIRFEAKPIWKADLQDRLARVYEVLGIYIPAERLYEDALHLKKKALGIQHQEIATALNNLATLYYTQSKYTEAESLYLEALQITKETIGTQHPAYAMYLNNLATLYRVQGKYAEVEPLFQEALQISKEMIGTQHPDYAIHLNNLAALYDAQGKYTEAKPLYLEALQIDKETIGTQHPDYATHLHNLGSMYYKMERYEEAKALLTEAYNICVATLGEQHPKTQATKWWLELVEAKL